MNLFSKIVSTIFEFPLAILIKVINCACRSVGKPGYSEVVIETGFKLPFDEIVIVLSVFFQFTPALIRYSDKDNKWRGSQLVSSNSPPVIAAAIAKLPASILSGITVCLHPFRLPTPSIIISLVPAPFILAPIEFKQFVKSIISGSFAALNILVLPFAKEAAIIIFSVAPTEILGNLISVP